MSGVEDRVREFLGNRGTMAERRDTTGHEIFYCCSCGTELADGSFKVIDGKLYCLLCREEGFDGIK